MSPITEAFSRLSWCTAFTDGLPLDPDAENHGVARNRQVLGAVYSPARPETAPNPELLASSADLAAELGLNLSLDSPSDIHLIAQVFSGNTPLAPTVPYATCYGGHQFGHWAGQLGDGRAMTLGHLRVPDGSTREIQLKGAGRTPYSRTADGKAVLRSSVREFLCSEAMHHLGVPTTRALTLVTTGESVVRDPFYDGHPRYEPGAIVCRVAPSFLRFGHYQIHAAREDGNTLQTLVDFTLQNYFPTVHQHARDRGLHPVVVWFEEVCRSTAIMVAHWMRVGFVHGVMNTDNMSIHGLTIDYGPYGWLEGYDPNWTPNTTDLPGRRYSFGRQPAVAGWNLQRFAQALYPRVGKSEPLDAALQVYADTFDREHRNMVAAKLGFPNLDTDEDVELAREAFEILGDVETDMTLFFRHLADVPLQENVPVSNRVAPLEVSFYEPQHRTDDNRARLQRWVTRYTSRCKGLHPDETTRVQGMNATNPKYVLRNYLVQQAIDLAEQGDASGIHELLDVMRHPYDEQPGREGFAKKRPEWARNKPGCSTLSCSS